MIRRPPRSTLDRSSAASDGYKRQHQQAPVDLEEDVALAAGEADVAVAVGQQPPELEPVSYTHLRAHETVLDLVCRLLLAKKNRNK